MKELLLLSPQDQDKNKPTKILDKDLNKIKSFDSGFKFIFEIVEYDSFHEILEKISKLSSSFLVLGAPTSLGRDMAETNTPAPRRKKKGDPTIKDRLGTEIVLDIDDHIIDGYDALSPEKGIKNWLAEKEINCDVTYQITSGQKLNTPEARIRLYFECSKLQPLDVRKAWSQSPEIMADGSVYTCSQPIYTAPPVIEGGVDPISRRWGFIQGETRRFKIPKLSSEEVKHYSGYQIGDQYDLTDPNIPEEVLSGKVYRRYFMPLAFHYVNLLKADREAVFAIIASKASQVKSREFNAENVYAYIDDAIDKIKWEMDYAKSELISDSDIEEKKEDDTPQFPENLLESWPAPWPMIYENFKKIPRQVEEALLVPTILSTNAYLLRSNFVTVYNRRPNFFFLNLTPSTGNKDVNSKNVIRDLDIIFKNRGVVNSIFSGILNTESNITADSTFIQSFSEGEELFWINTEATRIFQQIKNSGSVSAVAALSDKLIEVVDGHEITGKIKAAGKVKTIANPNCQVLFYAQPETIEKYIDESMVDSGLFGRSLLSIVPTLKFDIDSMDMFSERGGVESEIDDDFFDFYSSPHFNMSNLSSGKKILKPTNKSRELLNAWAKEYVGPKMAKEEAYQKVLSRIGNSAEQLYTAVLGICQIFDITNSDDPRPEIDVACLLPLLEYWVDTKIYAIDHFINSEFDPLAESILNIIKDCIAGKYKVQSAYDKKAISTYSMVPKSVVIRRLQSNTKLIRKLTADGDKRNATVRAEQIIKTFVSCNTLKEAHLKIGSSTKICIGLVK
jgi:hypothetical protein